MSSSTTQPVTTYTCDCCKRESQDSSFIFTKFEVPLRALDGGIAATDRFDLCEKCANLIADIIKMKVKWES